jgi:L-cysteine/cystine lyase
MRQLARRGELPITSGPAAGTTLLLEDELFVGSAATGPGRLGDDPAISPRHARLTRMKSGAVLVVDLGSSDGTWVNDVQVSTRELRDGDVLRFGSTTLEIAGTGAPGTTEADARAFRSRFPIFERVVYLNTGMEGPVPARAIAAADAQHQVELQLGRSGVEHWGNLGVLCSRLRERYARVLGCDAGDVGLTRATTDGVIAVLSNLRFSRGNEILTTDEEHQGVYAPLAMLRERHGCHIRIAPFDELAAGVTEETRLIACSHVSWLTGQVIDTDALKATGVPFLLDGAQALGAIPVDVRELGCDFYAASGQKWLCGPDRSGCLYVRADRIEDLSPPLTSNFFALADPLRPLDLVLAPGARRFDPGNLPGSTALWALAALDVIEEAGLDWVLQRGPDLAAQLAGRLRDTGLAIDPRGPSTLLAFPLDDPASAVEAFAAEGIVVRDVQGRVRISVGAWCLDEDIEKVVEVAARIVELPALT